MARHKNATWDLPEKNPGNDGAALGLLMDLRDELQALNRLMSCLNVMAGFIALQSIDRTLKRIDKRLAKKVKLR